MQLIGIDYSYGCPALASIRMEEKFDLDKIEVYAMINGACKLKTKTNVFEMKYYSDGCLIKKFNALAYKSIEFITKYEKPIQVAMEDYSFGSRSGRSFTIGENAGILKSKLYSEQIPLVLYSPSMIKRFAKECNEQLAVEFSDGKIKKDGSAKIGALNKIAMHEILCWKLNTRLEDYFELKKHRSPLSDIVDAIWILYILWLCKKVEMNNLVNLTEQEINFINNGIDGVPLYKKPFVFKNF
jgi:hypothetical protein